MPKTKIEYRQAIQNLSRLNTDGRYSERIALYWQEYDKLVQQQPKITRQTVKYTDEEVNTVMLFELDKRFETTE